MPLPLPELDDKDYEALVEEAIARIPRINPNWTDHNPSDPGITLVELFSWLTDLTLYRVNHIPEENYRTMLELLSDMPQHDDLEVAIHDVISDLRQPYRAVTAEDYEYLATMVWQEEEHPAVARASCFPRLNLEHPEPDQRFILMEGHVSLAVLPNGGDLYPPPLPSQDMLDSLYDFFKERRVLTTRHHVVSPEYVPIRIVADVVLHDDYLLENVQHSASNKLFNHLHPIYGGDIGNGWTFGRNVYLSEVTQLLDAVEGVDYVMNCQIAPVKQSDWQHLIMHPSDESYVIGLGLTAIELPLLTKVTLNQIGGLPT